MSTTIEIGCLDLRYEHLRVKRKAEEGRLLSSIAERGIEDALEGVDVDGAHVLLNGFARYRCARRLGIEVLPYLSLGGDEAAGIIQLLHRPERSTLTILEEAGFLHELNKVQGLNVAQIAERVGRSKAWVCNRLKLMREVSGSVRDRLFAGAFPIYAYMQMVHPFMRINGVKQKDVDEFVEALSGKKVSVRDVELLAHGYFRGPESFREQIRTGHVVESLERLKEIPDDPDGCSDFERAVLRDLETLSKYMQRVMGKSIDQRLKSHTFFAEANLLTAKIMSRKSAFYESMRQLHDRSGHA